MMTLSFCAVFELLSAYGCSLAMAEQEVKKYVTYQFTVSLTLLISKFVPESWQVLLTAILFDFPVVDSCL